MEDANSPRKNKPTSKVIDSLHSQIDLLKTELDSTKVAHDDYKKKYLISSKKNESFVDQLANAKHENDMINALLKRKERRIVDLEDQYNELCSTNESLKLNNKNMKIRCENLQELSASSTAEYERLKIAYDALIALQAEYKKHYLKEISTLTAQFEAYKTEALESFEALSDKLTNNDKDVDTLLESLTNKRKTMDNIYVHKNRAVLDLLSKLAKASKIHGQESKIVLQDNVDTITQLIAKHPDLQLKLTEHENVEVDLEDLLNDTNESLANLSFDEEATLINSPDILKDADQYNKLPVQQLSRNNTLSSKKRKSKRSSIRFDSKGMPDFSHINTPTAQPQLNMPKRNNAVNNASAHINRSSYLDSKSRTPTPPEENYKQTLSNLNHNPGYGNFHRRTSSNVSAGNNNNNNRSRSNNNQASHCGNNQNNRAKRRSLYGGNGANSQAKSHRRQGSGIPLEQLSLNT